MKNILTIFLLTLTVSCFGQTYGFMISKDPAQNADTANVLVMFPTGHANLTGRGHFISYETFAALIDPYITGGGGGGTWGSITGTLSSQTDLQTALNAKAASGANTDINSVILDNTGLKVKDGTKNLIITSNSSLSANRTLAFDVNNGDRTLDLESDINVVGAGGVSLIGGAYVEGNNTGDQDLSGYATTSALALKVNISDTASMLSHYIERQDTASMLSHYIERQDTSSMLNHYISRSDTASMLLPYLLESELPASRRTIYIDPFGGDSGNTGLSESQAITSPTDISILDNDNILLRGGSIFYEEFDFSTLDNIGIGRYGGGANPIIDGSSLISSWTDTAGISKTTVVNDVTTGRIRLYRESGALLRAVSLAECLTTKNTYYINQDGNADQSSTIIYLNVDDPTLDVYRYTKREFCINLTTGSVTDVDTRRALINNGSTIILGEGTISGGRADDGSKHNAFLGSGTIDGLRLSNSDGTTTAEPSNTYIATYIDDPRLFRADIKNVVIENEDNYFQIELGLLGHGATYNYNHLSLSDSRIDNVNIAIGGAAKTVVFDNNTFDNIRSICNVDAADSVLYITNNNGTFSRLTGNRSGISPLTYISGNMLYYPAADNATGNAAFYHTGTYDMDVSDNVIIVEDRRVFDAASTGGSIKMNHNILASEVDERLNYVPTGVTYEGDHNIFYVAGTTEVNLIKGATTYTDLLDWVDATDQDSNSVFLTDAQYQNLWVKSASGWVINPQLEVTDRNGNILEGYFPDSTRINFHHVFKSLKANTEPDWYEVARTPPSSNTNPIYHDGNVIVGDSIFGTTGKLNVVGRIDQRYPTNALTNIALGHSAVNASATGDYNAGIGYSSLAALTTGSRNLALGESSLAALTDGIQNVAAGSQSGLLGNPSASVAIGFQAMRSGSAQNTVAIGYGAAFTGGGNYAVHIGHEAGYKTTGGNNTFIGANAGHENVTGTSNVFLGQNAGYNETGSNFLYVDNSNTSTPLIKGDFNADTIRLNGALSIGTVSSGASTDSILVRTAATGKVKARDASLYATAAGLALKLNISDTAAMLTHFIERSDTASMLSHYIERVDTASMLTHFIERSDTASMLTHFIERADTASMLSHFIERADTATMLTKYARLPGRSGGQTLKGGTGTTDDLILQSTSGVGATGAEIQLKVGNNGATRAMTVLNTGAIGLGSITSPVTGSLEMPGSTSNSSLKVGAFETQSYAVNNGWLSDNVYFDGGTFRARAAGFGSMNYFYLGAWHVRVAASSLSAGAAFLPKIPFVVNRNTSIAIGGDITAGVGLVGSRMIVDSIGKVGINTSVADKQFEINLGTAEAFRLSYNDNNGSAATYVDQTLSSTGVVTNNAVGSASKFVFSDPFANTATSLTLGAAAATFALTSNVMTITGNGGGNTLTTITGGFSGQILVLKFVDANVTITDDATATANTINIGAAFTSTANDVISLMFDGTSWFETGRSVN